MFEIIRECIKEAEDDNTTFKELFVKYVIEVQDMSIGLEVDYILRHNILDPKVIDNMVALEAGGFNVFNKQ